MLAEAFRGPPAQVTSHRRTKHAWNRRPLSFTDLHVPILLTANDCRAIVSNRCNALLFELSRGFATPHRHLFSITTTNSLMSQYPVPPPSYGATVPSPKSPTAGDSLREPLLGSPRFEAGSSSGGIYNQPSPGELPDDFKVRVLD